MRKEEEIPDPEVSIEELPEWTNIYWKAWHDLQNDRFIGAMGGQGPIFYQAISQWARDHGMDGEEIDILKKIVMMMDEVYLEIQSKRSKEEADKGKDGQ